VGSCQPTMSCFNRSLIPSRLGGSAKPAEVYQYVAEALDIPDDKLELMTKNGNMPLFYNRVQWARFYLAKAGYIDSSTRGVWSITEKGRNATIGDEEAREITEQVARIAGTSNRTSRRKQTDQMTEDSPESVESNYRQQLLETLYDVSPSAFERICQRLLRESGFEQVTVTGRTGDGGIDGNGVLQLNPFVSFRVLFQSKRYRGAVGASVVRDFRGAMAGRADKGIILTTGSFTQDARREATRDGVPPIELVDGGTLVSLCESLEFGLKPKNTFEVDVNFFKDFEE
jgi:restriction system protein